MNWLLTDVRPKLPLPPFLRSSSYSPARKPAPSILLTDLFFSALPAVQATLLNLSNNSSLRPSALFVFSSLPRAFVSSGYQTDIALLWNKQLHDYELYASLISRLHNLTVRVPSLPSRRPTCEPIFPFPPRVDGLLRE